MRIVHCITGLTGDGAQRMLLRLVEQLQRRGVSSHVVSLSGREPFANRFEELGVNVSSLDIKRWRGGVNPILHLKKIIDEVSPDLTQGWMYHANLALLGVRPWLSKPSPIAWNIRRGMDDYQERKILTRLVIRANSLLSGHAQRIVYCTRESRIQHEAFGFCPNRGIVLGNGFDVDTFAPSEEMRRAFRARAGVGDSEILIGSVGRDDSAKGRRYLFEAFAMLLDRCPQARLLLIGRGMSESSPQLRRKLVSARIASRVIALGEYSPLSEVYPALDILCSSSVNEGFSNVVGEALSSGVPCVVTDTGNARALVEGSGLIVPPRSAPMLSQALLAMCEESADGRRQRGSLGRQVIAARHSLASVTDSYLSMYQEMVGCEGKGPLAPSYPLGKGVFPSSDTDGGVLAKA